MNETAISWTKYTNNPIRFRRREDGKIGWHCEKVSQGCSNCYAETLNMKWGTKDRFDVATTGKMEAFFDDKMMGELYKIKDASAKIFAFDMTDLFGAFIPDYLRAAAWCVILDLSQHTFQLLTKRPESAVQWAERFFLALSTPEFQALAKSVKHPKVKAALNRDWFTADVWASHIWMGTSVEDQKATKRIDSLRLVPAKTRFLSCEPLISSLGDVNLSGVSWVICGGESGRHLTDPSHPRWMKQEWARELRDACVKQGVAFFYKQDSGKVTEQRPYLVEADGTFWRWWQYPGDLVKPVRVNAKGEPIPTFDTGHVYDQPQPKPRNPILCADCGHDFGTPEERATNTSAEVIIHVHNGNVSLCGACFAKRNGLKQSPSTNGAVELRPTGRTAHMTDKDCPECDGLGFNPMTQDTCRLCDGTGKEIVPDTPQAPEQRIDPTPAPRKTRVVDFREVKQHWNKDTQTWDSDEYVYIGRANQYYNLPQSIWHNPYYIAGERGEAQARINVAAFRGYIRAQRTSHLLDKLETLRGKTLVCWCKDAEHPTAPCHGDVLLELLGEKEAVTTETSPEPPVQMRMF